MIRQNQWITVAIEGMLRDLSSPARFYQTNESHSFNLDWFRCHTWISIGFEDFQATLPKTYVGPTSVR